MFTVADALKLPVFKDAKVVAGENGLTRRIRWVHIVDVPEVNESVIGGELLLTTALSLHDNPDLQSRIVKDLAEKGLAGLVVCIGKFLEHIPENMLRDADRLDFPLIEVPWDIQYVDVTKAILERIVAEQYALLEYSLNIHRSFTQVVLREGNLAELARELSMLLSGKQVVIYSAKMDVLATAPDMPRGAERTAQERKWKVVNGRVKTESGTLVPVSAGSETMGYVWANTVPPQSAGGKHQDFDLLAVEQAATVAALIMLREKAVWEVENRLRGDLLGKLLHPLTKEEIDSVLYSASRFGLDLTSPHQVMVMELTKAGIPKGTASLIRSIEKVRGMWEKPFLVGESSGRIVGIAEVSPPSHKASDLAMLIAGKVPEIKRIGIGGLSGKPQTIEQSYRGACEAVAVAEALGWRDKIVEFSSLGMWHWLYRIPEAEIAGNEYYHKIENLVSIDERKGGELVKSLRVYLENGGNALKTARDLYVHRSTLNYRLKRLEGILKVDLSNPKERAETLLALNMFLLQKGRSLHCGA
jgi:purine catabolism regulator